MNKIFILVISNTLLIYLINSATGNNEKEKYLTFSFQRNLTLKDSMGPEQVFIELLYNQIYINLKVGSEKQEIPFYLYLQQFPLVIESSRPNKGEVKGIYDEKSSSTYRALEDEVVFDKGDLVKGILSEEQFYLNSNPMNINFYLAIENYGDSHIQEGGRIGLKNSDDYGESQDSNFVKNLKKLNLIASYDISILYNSNKLDEDTGILCIGTLPHIVNNNKYNDSEFMYAHTKPNDALELSIKNTLLNNIPFEYGKMAYFYPEFGFIKGTTNFFDALNKMGKWYEYFNINKKCHTAEFQISDFKASDSTTFLFKFYGFYCDKDVDINDVLNETLTFNSSLFRYGFIFNNKDLWMERNGYKFFMILKSYSDENDWVFGKPFFKKYHMVFNQEAKTIGFYANVYYNYNRDNNEVSKGKKILYICIISVLIFIVGLLAFFLIRIYINKPRKKRANELLDDNFEYKERENNENKIISPDGENKN